MSLTRFSRVACSLSLLIGIHLVLVSNDRAYAQVEPPPGSGAPSGTVGGGSRS